jgi:membrane-associated PAP2 superfamily phosphatase
MNRTGLLVVLALAVAIGTIFAAFPDLDLHITRLFFEPRSHWFMLTYYMFVDGHMWLLRLRDATMWIVTALALAPVAALILKLLRPTKSMLMSPRSIMFLLGTLALAPGVLANGVLKEHWGRPRPIEVREFNGSEAFVPWWDPRGTCDQNCSFISGEGAGAFWTLAPAALAPPPVRAAAYAASLAFGSAVGVMRIAVGGHFFTDIAFAGVFTFLIVWIAYALLFRWPVPLPSDATIERAIERLVMPLHAALGRTLALRQRPGPARKDSVGSHETLPVDHQKGVRERETGADLLDVDMGFDPVAQLGRTDKIRG